MIYAGRLPKLDIVSYKSRNVSDVLQWNGKHNKGFFLGTDCDRGRIVLGWGHSVITFRLPYLNQKLKNSLDALEEHLEADSNKVGRVDNTDSSTHENDEMDISELSISELQSCQSEGDAGDTSENNSVSTGIRSNSEVGEDYSKESIGDERESVSNYFENQCEVQSDIECDYLQTHALTILENIWMKSKFLYKFLKLNKREVLGIREDLKKLTLELDLLEERFNK